MDLVADLSYLVERLGLAHMILMIGEAHLNSLENLQNIFYSLAASDHFAVLEALIESSRDKMNLARNVAIGPDPDLVGKKLVARALPSHGVTCTRSHLTPVALPLYREAHHLRFSLPRVLDFLLLVIVAPLVLFLARA